MTTSENFNGTQTGGLGQGSPEEALRKVKDLEKKVTKLRNDNQTLSSSLDKATRLLERELGEIVDIEALSREDSKWKGRAQKIEIYKTQLKKYKMQSTSTSQFGDDLSVISETPSVFPGRVTHAERNLNRLGADRQKDFEQMKQQLADKQAELQKVKDKLTGVNARNKILESQVKDVRSQFSGKMQILIEKTENDDKLINMLKQELQRLEQVKNVKSTLHSGMRLKPLNETDELTRLRGENGRLKNQVKCLQIDVEQRQDKINHLVNNVVGAPDEKIEEAEAQNAELEQMVNQLQEDLFRAREEIAGLMASGAAASGQATQVKKHDESDKLIKDITKQNALLRRKLDDAQQKIQILEGSPGKKK